MGLFEDTHYPSPKLFNLIQKQNVECLNCLVLFKKKIYNQIYCSKKCSEEFYNNKKKPDGDSVL